MSKIKYPSINGLRAISILMVITHHFFFRKYIVIPEDKVRWFSPFTDFIQDGHLGVNVFFVISGFLITSLMLEEEALTKTVSFKNFYIRRTLRIFPAYYFLLAFYFVLQLLGVLYLTPMSWLTSITYTKYFNWHLDWITNHAWSLSIEEQFYLFWPLIFTLGNKLRKTVAIAFIIIVPMIRTLLNFYPIDWMNELTIFLRIDSIATGCLFALYRDEIIQFLSKHWKRFFYVCALCLIVLRYASDAAHLVHLKFIFVPFGLTHGTIANFLIAVIMLFSIFGPRGLWFKFLNSKILNYIGLLSYSLYLWQQFFLSGGYFWVTRFPQNLFFIAGMAIFSYYVIEKPFLKLKAKFYKKKQLVPSP